jgi:hypothetical protein
MTPLQFAQTECPNWNQGACSGARIADDLTPLPGRPLAKCALAVDQRCEYFEECVLPMAAMVSDPEKSKSYLDAAANYKFKHHISGLSRRCPECGGPLPTRKRFCAGCTSQHRQKSNRDAVRRFRDVAVSS